MRYNHIIRWIKILSGKSYFHQDQGRGILFTPFELNGYFNDMTKKCNWPGLVDNIGIPLIDVIGKGPQYFAITIVQKGLGHFDNFLKTSSQHDSHEFFKIADWFIENQDDMGGWRIDNVMTLEPEILYSAMAQGEVVSLLVRAWSIHKEVKYLTAAKKAYSLMVQPVSEGGCALYMDKNVFLEECPSSQVNTVLNGWIFAIFGVYDLFLATNDLSVKAFFELNVETLLRTIDAYIANFWSYYDLKKNISSPFYHKLVISQLICLNLIIQNKKIDSIVMKFNSELTSKKCYLRALAHKGFQKILSPGDSLAKC